MAWPCITRACCINRFWSELDKADIAVPLVFTKYSDVADVQHLHHHPQPKQKRAGAIAIETQPHLGEQEAVKAPPATGAAAVKDGSTASVMRQDFKAWKVRPEPSCKPRNEYQPSVTPFNNETQYQKDYKPWPIPRKGDHPWIPKPGSAASSGRDGSAASNKLEHAASEAESGVEKSEIEEKVQEKESKEVTKKATKKEKSVEKKTTEKMKEKSPGDASSLERKGRAAADALNQQIKEVVTTGSSYRNEFKAYKDVKPVKPIKAPSQYKPPVEETSLETSYSATFKGEQAKAHPTDNKLMERRRIRSLYSEPGKEPPKDFSETESSSVLNLL
ncbi:microtubule-associated protein 6 homolog isoform X2 [Myripristis murdjan]|uniref:microtubule-associated protein 6 homolog isoform X2 n=1 Tax=Myripristis murdjan TaxID=586833 RepID=UPI0011763236|nr:microtubule-associated protein 6 homolog isoform X2 [Myripristis murdjan]